MNTDERLNQLEPLVAEALAVLDRHTAQLKQLNNAVAQNTQVLIQQSDNISFLLREHIVIKDDVATLKGDVATLTGDVSILKGDVATLKGDVATIRTDVAEMRAEFGSKLDLILAKIK
jgi:lipopolysaccharide export system protein LptA